MDALALFHSAPYAHLAALGPDGPVLRAVHVVDVDGALCFHGALRGEKAEAIPGPATLAVEQVLAEIPSTWLHPERACPATTYFRGALATGRLEAVDDPATKARVLQALMERFQPQGGYRPLDDPMYRAAVAGTLVVRLAEATLTARLKVGQERPAATRGHVAARLWARGRPGDPAAVEAMREVGDLETPAFLRGPDGVALRCALGPAWAPAAAALLADTYWNRAVSPEGLAQAHLASPAWVGATVGDRLVATARALSDGVKLAYVMDVCVAEDWRGRGVGAAVMRLLLDHPAVRGCRRVELHTRDAAGLYERLGFSIAEDPPWRIAMRRVRPA